MTESGYAYTYDNNGNMLTKSGNGEQWQLAYNALNQLTRANISGPQGSSVIDYAYDHDGIRIGKTVNGTDVTSYVVDKNRPYAQVLEEEHLSGGLSAVTSYVYGDALISGTIDGTLTQYYHADGMGSVRGLSDSSGVMTDRYSYDAYGMLLDSSGASANSYRYRGEQYDSDLESYYLRARYYQPGTGRFLTTDPFEGSPTTPMSLHRYLYGNDDPIRHVDPSGRMSVPQMLVGTAITNVLLGIAVNTNFMGMQDVYVALGETFFPDAFVVGVSGTIPREISDLIESIFSAVPGAVGTLGLDITGNVTGAYEGVFSTSSAEIALFGILGGGVNVGAYGGGQTHTRSLYWGYVWNLWNTDNYSGPFVSLGVGSVAFACSPTDFIFGPWGITRGATVTGYGGGSLSTSLTNYIRLGNKTLWGEGEAHWFSLQILPLVQLAVQILQDRSISATALMANFSFWLQAGDAKRFWNKSSGHTVKERQKPNSRPPDFQSGPGMLMLGQML